MNCNTEDQFSPILPPSPLIALGLWSPSYLERPESRRSQRIVRIDKNSKFNHRSITNSRPRSGFITDDHFDYNKVKTDD